MPRYKSMQTYIDAQVHHWQQKKNQINLTEEQMDINLPFLTLSREYGSGGYEVASRITETLNREGRNNTWAAYDKALMRSS
jgi:hypothetical protein